MKDCKGRTRTGAACRAPAGAGGLCFFHANPDSPKQLGRLGGQKNRRSAVDLEVPDNMTASDLCKVTGQAMRLLLSGELGAREASAFAQLCNSLYRVIPTVDLEMRLTMLEKQIIQEGQAAQKEGGIAPDNYSSDSTTDEIEVSETFVSVNSDETASSIDATSEQGEPAESVIDEPGEGEEA